MLRLMTVLAALMSLFSGAARADDAPTTRLTPINDGVPGVVGDGLVRLYGQPGPDDFAVWSEAGVTTVVNFRSQAENASLAFDPEAEATKHGLRYVTIPMGGADGAGRHITAALTSVLAESEGPVALHCRSGTRAAHAYAAHLVASGALDAAGASAALGWPGGLNTGTLQSLIPSEPAP